MTGTLRRFIRLGVFASLIAPSITMADEYQWQVRGDFDRVMPSNDFLDDVDTLQLAGTWYFAPVSTDNVPLAEAAYLGRASYLSAIAARFEIFETTLNAQGANVGYYIPGTMFYAGVGVSHGQTITGINSVTVQKEYDTNWFGTFGVTPLDGLLITTDFDEDGYDPNVTARHVGKLPNSHFYAGSVSIVDPDGGDTAFGVDFDYYFDDTTSAGVGYFDGGERWELRAEKFFSKTWAAGITGYTADGGDGIGVHVTWRH
jgi:hypothetical protein